MRGRAAIALAVLIAAPAGAQELPLPASATLAAEETQALDSVSVPVGPWRDGAVEALAVEGRVGRQAWRLPRTQLTTLQILQPMRDALTGAGYEILFSCKDKQCGGFDFRYELALLPEPDMHVDLGDFRYLAARRGSGDTADAVALTVSRSADAGFVHVTRVGQTSATVVPEAGAVASVPEPEPAAPRDLGGLLLSEGRAVLDDLRFATGSAELEATLFPSLVALAEWLEARPEARVVLVGHSDAVGALEANIALSKARAQSAVDRLISAHGVASSQVSAEGVGYLVPRAPNDTAEGRARNRRVEAVRLAP